LLELGVALDFILVMVVYVLMLLFLVVSVRVFSSSDWIFYTFVECCNEVSCVVVLFFVW
uniref:NADH dehydrogenase subunit 1 n=1 Tax=Mesocestoides corti TaxID=53468 RepID=A0A0R3UDQ4_MESCO